MNCSGNVIIVLLRFNVTHQKYSQQYFGDFSTSNEHFEFRWDPQDIKEIIVHSLT